ncbi:uncharacterized protein C8Q71DRAFT_736371 [Rhodofomes roseus]|uniref:Secreted protein n=1 Tax=Rhodofomes roseus TaxID=34475 RepID=A0ABQ8KWJ2_9APHY|nr:uncharacterized protein C8Q71DRAFT_736371 [Rhodofomes roseus]KAH9843192.1 hypothetical protein C8Q71DRAFT_736371 [Rhodofomes roseus]
MLLMLLLQVWALRHLFEGRRKPCVSRFTWPSHSSAVINIRMEGVVHRYLAQSIDLLHTSTLACRVAWDCAVRHSFTTAVSISWSSDTCMIHKQRREFDRSRICVRNEETLRATSA